MKTIQNTELFDELKEFLGESKYEPTNIVVVGDCKHIVHIHSVNIDENGRHHNHDNRQLNMYEFNQELLRIIDAELQLNHGVIEITL